MAEMKHTYIDTNPDTGRHQADCNHCGWHTRQVDADDRWWVEKMAARHEKLCPFPHPPIKTVLVEERWAKEPF